METIIELTFPEKVAVVLTVTSTIAELKELREQITHAPGWSEPPLGEFMQRITRAIDAATERWDSILLIRQTKPA